MSPPAPLPARRPDRMLATTRQLVSSAQGGDDEAVQQLFARYYPRLERIVRARLGPRLRARLEVEDVLQEAFLQAVLRLEEFEMRSESAFLDWLATIALNRIRKAAQRWSTEKRDDARLTSIDAQADDGVARRVRDLTARVTGPVTRAVRGERDAALEEALDELSEEHREVIVLRHMVGLSHAEIADRIGRPSESAAREFYRRARAKLAIALRGKGLAEEAGGGEGAR